MAAALLALALPLTRASAQASTVNGVVVSDSGVPISGAVVRILWSDAKGKLRDRIVRSDDAGAFRIEKLAAGSYALTVQRPGFAAYDAPFTIGADGTSAQLLAEMVTAAPEAVGAGAPTMGAMADFERRRKGSSGHFLTRADIDRRRPRVLSDALRTIPNTTIDGDGGGERAIVFRAGSVSMCRPDVYIDGIPSAGASVDAIAPQDVEGVEVYQSIAQTPVIFRFRNQACGAIVIWTRSSLSR